MYQDGAFVASAVVHAPEIADIPGTRSQGVSSNLFDLVRKGEEWFAEVDLKLATQLITRAREQGLRATLLADRGCLGVLSTEDLDPARLAERMARQLRVSCQGGACPVDINGAANTARWITETLPHVKSLP
jgi:hypothetical protein